MFAIYMNTTMESGFEYVMHHTAGLEIHGFMYYISN